MLSVISNSYNTQNNIYFCSTFFKKVEKVEKIEILFLFFVKFIKIKNQPALQPLIN
jgi:hypothetical protein